MKYRALDKKLSGFSLIELLIVMAILTFVSVILLPPTITQLRATNIDGEVSDITSLIYQYQQNAYFGLNNKSYGVRFGSTSYTIFIGDSFAASDSSEVVQLEPGLVINSVNLAGGGSDLIFSKGTLKPNATGSIQITNSTETYQILINSEGFVEYIKI